MAAGGACAAEGDAGGRVRRRQQRTILFERAGVGRASNIVSRLTPKRLELLSELVPQARVIALLVNPNNTTTATEPMIADMREAACAKRVRLEVLKAGTESEIDAAFATLVEVHAGGLVVAGGPFFGSRRDQLVTLASRYAVPMIYWLRLFADAGGLISYGIDNIAVFRQAGS